MANFRIIDRSTIEVPPECVTDPDLANCLLWAFPYIVEDLTNGSYCMEDILTRSVKII